MKTLLAALLLTAVAFPAQAQLGGLGQALQGVDQGARPPARSTPRENTNTDAQATPAAPTEVPPLQSEFCAFSFFSDGPDEIDFSGSTFDPCFDTGGGEDRFVLQPEDYPQGVRVFSKEGRSFFRFSNGPTVLFDQDSTAREVRAGLGDDTLRFGTPFKPAGQRATLMPETRVYPGGGSDLIVVGSGLRPELGPREAANLIVFPQGGQLGIEAGCGRPQDTDTIDFIVENADPQTQMAVTARGCGVAIRNHAAPTVLDQVGGRTSLVLRPRLLGDPPAVFEATIAEGSGLSAIVIDPSSQVRLEWQGYNTATLQIEALTGQTAGYFEIESAELVFAGGVIRAGAPEVVLSSAVAVEMVLEGEAVQGMQASLMAPEMIVEWRMDGVQPPNLRVGPAREMLVPVSNEQDVRAAEEGTVESQEAESAAVEAVAEEESAVVEESVQEEGESNRSQDGMTQAARESMAGGYPLGSVPFEAPRDPRQGVMTPVQPGLVELVLRPRSGVCERIVVVRPSESIEVSCDQAQTVSGVGATRLEIRAAGGLQQTWDLDALPLGNIRMHPR